MQKVELTIIIGEKALKGIYIKGDNHSIVQYYKTTTEKLLEKKFEPIVINTVCLQAYI